MCGLCDLFVCSGNLQPHCGTSVAGGLQGLAVGAMTCMLVRLRPLVQCVAVHTPSQACQ